MTLTVGSLFAGIGGFDLGFERAGMRTEWFVEQDPYCQAVLRKHWPDVPIFDDVCTVSADNLPRVDVLCGGFPCQDISSAGKGAGLAGSRSGLWFEFERLIGELRPGYVVVENVPVLRTRGLDTVITGLASLGYDAEWSVVSAAEAGAPHLRKRLWIVAYPAAQLVADPYGESVESGRERRRVASGGESRPDEASQVADSHDTRRVKRRRSGTDATKQLTAQCGGEVSDAERSRRLGAQVNRPRATEARGSAGWADGSGWWAVEPDVGRVAHGVPMRIHRLRSLGNALVPQIAEEIGRRIVACES